MHVLKKKIKRNKKKSVSFNKNQPQHTNVPVIEEQHIYKNHNQDS